ncbi:MAG: MarR family winged helix-turn-helix transcriptional regulator [Quadrisphaera sp.]
MSDAREPAVHEAGTGQLLFQFVRHWSRRSDATGGGGEHAEQGRLVVVSEAVHALQRRGAPVTVNAVSHELGIDQSGASRLVKDAVQAGYVAVSTASHDGRRRLVSLTPAGSTLLQQAHRWQEEVFARMTAGWSDQRRRDFHQSMADLLGHPAGAPLKD